MRRVKKLNLKKKQKELKLAKTEHATEIGNLKEKREHHERKWGEMLIRRELAEEKKGELRNANEKLVEDWERALSLKEGVQDGIAQLREIRKGPRKDKAGRREKALPLVDSIDEKLESLKKLLEEIKEDLSESGKLLEKPDT